MVSVVRPAVVAGKTQANLRGRPAEGGDVCECRTYPCLYANVDYLQWWLRRRPSPVLLTTGDPADPIPGGLGQPGTRILHGLDDPLCH